MPVKKSSKRRPAPRPKVTIVKLGDLPKAVTDDIAMDIVPYTVTFLDLVNVGRTLGSGVLVSAGSTRAVLTADHVLQRLPRKGRIGVFLGKASAPHHIDAAGVSFLTLGAYEEAHARVGPDLGVLVLAPPIAGAIAAKKSFCILDAHRPRMLDDPPHLRDGAWFAQGFLAEKNETRSDATGTTFYMYNFTGIGGPHRRARLVGEHDYYDFMVSQESRPIAPKTWGGMSGCGLWQVLLKRAGDSFERAEPPLLSGILFYQHDTTARSAGVRAHGRRSVYEVAYKALVGTVAR